MFGNRLRRRRLKSPPAAAATIGDSSSFRRYRRRRTPTLSSLRRFKIPPKQPLTPLSRASSDPILCTVRLLDDQENPAICRKDEPSLYLPSPHTCSDFVLPSLPSGDSNFDEGVKVVVNVTVEGSSGPVKAMVRLGASVEEAIGVIVEQYGREGRSPSIGRGDAAGFQLHHSHFSLQSLGKCEKIGQVGGRSFYLRTSSGRSEGTDLTAGSSEMSLVKDSPCPVPLNFFIAFICTKMRKIGRRTKKIWRMVACITCS